MPTLPASLALDKDALGHGSYAVSHNGQVVSRHPNADFAKAAAKLLVRKPGSGKAEARDSRTGMLVHSASAPSAPGLHPKGQLAGSIIGR